MCVVRSAVQQFATISGFGEEECRSIVLAVDEALTNVIRHAYGNRPDQAIEVICRRIGAKPSGADRAGIEFVLVDHGRPADPAELRGRPLGDVRPGGLGTHLIAEIMDDVRYEPLPDRNQMRLVKYLSEKSSGGE